MSKRRDLDRHLHSLREIRDIMNAMKNLALMETHKLSQVLANQRRVLADLETMAADFFFHYPHLVETEDAGNDICILFGSERGFCGDFNERVAEQALARAPKAPLIVIGSRLADRLTQNEQVAARIAGPGAFEEVESVLLELMQALDTWQAGQRGTRSLRPTVFHHQADLDTVKILSLHPFHPVAAKPPAAYPPRLTVPPREFLARFTEHYLLAALCASFYDSMMAENQRRMRHMTYAVERIDQDSRKLMVRRNILRQEEITEEIEVIMLSLEQAR